jgi:geranylgeranylglyceryl phosphate synthase family protein
MDKKETYSANRFGGGRKSVGLLLDPDKATGVKLEKVLEAANESRADFILAGGSLTSRSIDDLIANIKNLTSIPIILFPGNLLQISLKADVIFFLSLISGRNPEFLIGNHVVAAPFLENAREKIVPVGYMLIGGGSRTSVEYMSQTEAIPADKPDIAVATALAGEMLGMRLIYLEAGSGAGNHVPTEIISEVKKAVNIPVAVGGGIRSSSDSEFVFGAGADLVVLGNGCEENPELLRDVCRVRDKLRKRDNPVV